MEQQGFQIPEFSRHTVDKLLANVTGPHKNKNYSSLSAIQADGGPSQLVDILITNSWPTCISQFSSLPAPDLLTQAGPPVDIIMQRVKPRYQFSASKLFWEREPFVWDDEQGRISRFVSLGTFAGPPPPEGTKRSRVCICQYLLFLIFNSMKFASGFMHSRLPHWKKELLHLRAQ
jgi:hypothetical protein